MNRFDNGKRLGTSAFHRARAVTGALVAFGIAAAMPAPASAQEISDDWLFSAAIYAWLPDIAGDVTVPTGGTVPIGVDIETILDHLEMVGQAAFSLQKGHWGAFTDVIYLGVGESKSQTRNLTVGGVALPAGVTGAVDFDLDTLIWMLGGSFRLAASPAATLDLFAGGRLSQIDTTLEWNFTGNFGQVVPPPRTGKRETSSDQLDAIAGIKGHLALGSDHNWVVPFYLDVGTGDSDLTVQAMLGFGYAFGWGEVDVAWRYLEYDFDSSTPVEELNFSGPALGVLFRW